MWAQEQLVQRFRERMARGEAVSDADLWRLSENGAKMAGMAARSKVSVAPPDLTGFRAGAKGLPSPRMGHSRIRSIDGGRRPVKDEGRADRKHYNARAREEGGPLLPE